MQPRRSPKTILAAVLAVVCVGLMSWQVVRFAGPRSTPNATPPTPPTPGQEAARIDAAVQQGREAESKASAARVAKFEEQSVELATVLSRKQRWTRLPAFAQGTYADPSGRVWVFGHAAGDDPALLTASVERAAARKPEDVGRPALVVGGHVLLVEPGGRTWVREYGGRHGLLAYDGKAWERAPRPALPLPPDGQADALQTIDDAAFVDAAGNAFFIYSNPYGAAGIRQRAPNGTWKLHTMSERDGHDHLLTSKPRFAGQANGRVTVYDTWKSRVPPAECRVPHFDGTAWSEVNPVVCGMRYHDVKAVIPVPDGSILTLCSGNRLWTYWPPGTEPAGTKPVAELVADLGEADPRVREQASVALIHRGRPALAELEAAFERDDAGPEARIRLRDVIQGIRGTFEDDHASAGLHGGRLVFGAAEFLSRGRDGSVRLVVADCEDRRTGEKFDHAIVTVRPDGQWEAGGVPMEQWRRAGIRRVPDHCFEDRKGNVWLTGTHRLGRNNEAELVAPDGLNLGESAGLCEDADGRIYAGNQVFDPSVPADTVAAAGDLAHEEVLHGHRLHLADASRAGGWSVESKDDGAHVWRFEPSGELRPVPRNWTHEGIQPLPLDGGLVAGFSSSRIMPPHPVQFWDGQVWHDANTLEELIQAYPEAVAKAAVGASFVQSPLVSFRVAGNADGGLWFLDRKVEGPPEFEHFKTIVRFDYFDGTKWHDVWREAGLEEADNAPSGNDAIQLAIDGGRAILVEEAGQYQRIAFEEGKVVARALRPVNDPGPNVIRDAFKFAAGADGQVWFTQATPNKPLLRYHQGAITESERGGRPIRVDSKGRLWMLERFPAAALNVHAAGAWGRARIPGLLFTSTVVESHDGRIWLLHGEGLSQLDVETGGDEPVIREVGRYKWEAPKNDFSSLVFCDTAGRLWIEGQSMRYTRYTLPAAK